MKKILIFFVLLAGCKPSPPITHPLLREDGFYYRRKSHDLFQLIQFYANGRVAVEELYCKQESFSKYQNRVACMVDSTSPKKLLDRVMSSFIIEGDSIHFLKNTRDPYAEPYSTQFLCKIKKDSLLVQLKAVDIKSLRGNMEKTNKFVTFMFVKADCDPDMPVPENTKYDLDTDKSFQIK